MLIPILSDLLTVLPLGLQDAVPAVPSLDGGASPVTPGGGGQTQRPPSLFSGNFMFWALLLMMVFLIFTTVSSSRREKKRMAEMLGSIKRGDKVQMTGGLIGTVDQVKDDEVVIRIDEVTGAKAHFAKTAVQHVIRSGKGSKADTESATA